jgi:hypothetical protein
LEIGRLTVQEVGIAATGMFLDAVAPAPRARRDATLQGNLDSAGQRREIFDLDHGVLLRLGSTLTPLREHCLMRTDQFGDELSVISHRFSVCPVNRSLKNEDWFYVARQL